MADTYYTNNIIGSM